MSNDLISRSALIESFRKCYVDFGHVEMENSNSLMTFASICRVIKEEPATYDVNKVLEQLEEASYYTEDGVHAVVGCGRAKGIVKAGGSE